MATARVASRYAKALLSLAEERGELDAVANDLVTLDEVVGGSADLAVMLNSPVVKADKKQAVLDAVFSKHVSTLTMGYLRIMVGKGREGLIGNLAIEGKNQLRLMRNVKEVSLTTASPLTSELREKVLGQVAKVHNGEVELQEQVDPNILGGYILKMGDQMVDASIKRQLRSLGRELTEHDYEPEF